MADNSGMRERLGNTLKRHSGKNLELYWENRSKLELTAMKGELSSFTLSKTRGTAARVLKDSRMGFSYTEDPAEDALDGTVRKAGENALHIAEDKGNVLYASDEELESERFFNPALGELPVEKKRSFVLDLEKAGYDFDKRVVNVPRCFYGDISHERVVTSSHGLYKSEKQSFCYSYLYVMAREGEDTTVGFWGMGTDKFEELDRDRIVKMSIEEALDQLGAGEIESGKYPIILSQDVASDILEAFFGSHSPFFAENVQLGMSRLKGREGAKIGSEAVTVVDDPFAKGMGRREFDGEGVPSQKMTVIDGGKLSGFFYSLYAAAREGKTATGHGDRPGYRGGISTSISNVILENGVKKEEELIRQVDRGIYVSNVEGLHASLDPVSGDFSLSSKGKRIEKGELTGPVKNFTIASNFYDFLMKIADKADNRRSDGFSAATSPSLLLEELDVAGK